MCALFGYLDCGKKIPHKILQKLVQALANASEERGDHASGIAYKCGGKLTIYKRPRPAHKMKFHIPKGHNRCESLRVGGGVSDGMNVESGGTAPLDFLYEVCYTISR